MCNVNCFIFTAKNITREEIEGKRLIEVGSYDVNGSLRHLVQLLNPAEYVGLDIEAGPGVDVICEAEKMVEKFGPNSFDVVISSNALEHMRYWREAVSNIKNICKPQGLIFIIVPAQIPFHGYPHDYWRYSLEDIKNIFADCEILQLEEDLESPSLVYAKIRKPAEFKEIDLSDYPLYSILLDKRVINITDAECQKYLKWLVFKDKIKENITKLGKRILNY